MEYRFHVGRVVEPHAPTKQSPLKLISGDSVRVIDDLPEQPGWVQVADRAGNTGRVPSAFLSRNKETATVNRDYDETELSLRRGKVIILGEESGWLWCVDRDKHRGWLPRNKVRLME